MRRPVLIALAVLGALVTALVAVWRLRADHEIAPLAPDQPLDSMTRDELYELARERDIPGRSRMKKAELRDALRRP